jgi:hypothetical protein
MFRPIRAGRFFPLELLEVFFVKRHTGSLGGSDMMQYSHGVMECWSTGVMGKDEGGLVLFLIQYSNTPTLQHSSL